MKITFAIVNLNQSAGMNFVHYFNISFSKPCCHRVGAQQVGLVVFKSWSGLPNNTPKEVPYWQGIIFLTSNMISL